jgi:hypothetical protein
VDAQAREYDMLKAIGEPMVNRMKNLPRDQRARMGKVVAGGQVVNGKKLYMHELIAFALNMGNEGNKDKLLGGYNMTEDQAWELLNANMLKEDWDLVQDIWDDINSLWPEIEALHKRVTGIAPPKVEAVTLTTPYGQYRGGYYPVVYDRRLSAVGERAAKKLITLTREHDIHMKIQLHINTESEWLINVQFIKKIFQAFQVMNSIG